MTVEVEPLIRLAHQLGIGTDALVQAERVDRLAGTFEIPSEAVAGLTERTVIDVAHQYENAIRVTIGTGSLAEFAIENGAFDSEALSALIEEASRIAATYRATIEIDKKELARHLVAVDGDAHVRLFMFATVVADFLSQAPSAVERDLWQEPTKRLVCIVLDTNLLISGPCLAVVGGDHQDDAADECLKPMPDGLERLANRRNDYVGWDSALSTGLTPLHFQHVDDGITGPLHDRLVLLSVGLGAMYLSDRSRHVERANGTSYTRAEFRGREHVASVPIDWTASLPELSPNHVDAVQAVVTWCYEPIPEHRSTDMVGDRLPFVQTRVAQLLESRDETDRLLALALAMPAISEGVKWHWRSFIEGRVSEYLEQVRELEAAVTETVVQLTDRTSSLAKRLSETSLAAIAALIGSFIAAAFKDPFQAELFRIGMLAYAGYVLVFPFALGVASSVGDARVAMATFTAQRMNMANVLGEERVDEIVASRPRSAHYRFVFWARLVSVLYLLAIVAAVAAAVVVPGLIEATSPTASTIRQSSVSTFTRD